jgi:hypothetical protein
MAKVPLPQPVDDRGTPCRRCSLSHQFLCLPPISAKYSAASRSAASSLDKPSESHHCRSAFSPCPDVGLLKLQNAFDDLLELIRGELSVSGRVEPAIHVLGRYQNFTDPAKVQATDLLTDDDLREDLPRTFFFGHRNSQ